MSLRTLALIAAATAVSATTGYTQDWQPRVVPPPASPPKVTAPAPAPRSSRSPAAPVPVARPAQPLQTQPLQTQVHFLIRTTLLALNDANRTGNYTVLRDLSAPTFRDRNSAADLSQIFGEMRRAKLDLGIAALMPPELNGGPTLDADRRLVLKGFYATEPNRVLFDLHYEAVGGHWLLQAVSISTAPSRTASNAAPAAAMR